MTLESPWTLPGLTAFNGTGAPGILLVRDDTAKQRAGERLFKWPGRFGLELFAADGGWVFKLNSGAFFFVDGAGKRIACDPGPKGWTEVTAEGLVRRILPRVIQLHGSVVMHGAALKTESGVVLLCGRSGAGKSTLAAALQRDLGWEILDDDMAVLEKSGAGMQVWPNRGGLGLREDARTILAGTFGHAEARGPGATKFRCQLPTGVSTEAGRLAAIYHLAQTSDPESDEVRSVLLDPEDGVVLLGACAIQFNPADRRAQAVHFPQLVGLALQMPVRQIVYPRRFEILSRVIEHIAAECAARKPEARP